MSKKNLYISHFAKIANLKKLNGGKIILKLE